MHTSATKAEALNNLQPEKPKAQDLEPLTILQNSNNLELVKKAWQEKKMTANSIISNNNFNKVLL